MKILGREWRKAGVETEVIECPFLERKGRNNRQSEDRNGENH